MHGSESSATELLSPAEQVFERWRRRVGMLLAPVAFAAVYLASDALTGPDPVVGRTESLMVPPATMTHVSMGRESRRITGISDTLLWLSVGIEEEAALTADLEQALERATRAAEVAVAG